MTSSLRVVTMGEVLAVFLGDTGLPLESAVHFERSFAGAESNVAVGLARLGVPVTFIGVVGGDALGRAAIRALRSEGVAVDTIVVSATRPTGILVRSVAGPGITEVVYGRAVSAGTTLNEEMVTPEVFSGAGAFHVTGITPMLSASAAAATDKACKLALSAGVPISFDPNVRLRLAPAERWATDLHPYLSVATFIFTGADEATLVSGTDSVDEAVRRLHGLNGATVVVKDGPRGAKAWTGDHWTHAPVYPVTAIDPVGAGDAFNAGFLASWHRGASLIEALDAGAVHGAATVAVRGDTTAGAPLPTNTYTNRDVIR